MPTGRKLRAAIIGCGRIGRRRAETIANSPDRCEVVVCADSSPERAVSLASSIPGALAVVDWRDAVSRPDIDIVMVATTHNALAEISLASVVARKHVLVEKPAARRAADLNVVLESARTAGVCVRVGFNHRYHPALRKAKELVKAGRLGGLMFVRGRYGHGGRIGYDREWRARPELSGGGELIDQGIHLIDLARWFLGEFVGVAGFATTYFWDMPVEDNGFMILKTARNRTAFLHASCTEWKNMFSFEIYGQTGKLDVNGLGGSYGTERIAFYQMHPSMGPPETTIWEYPMADDSWDVELAEFIEDVRSGRPPSASLTDAQAALQIVERIYELSRQ